MPVVQEGLHLETAGFSDVHELTEDVQEVVGMAGIGRGLATVFVPGSTGAITTIEFEPGAVADLQRAIERLAPRDMAYEHDQRWGDGNGFSHVRAALLGPSLSVPVQGGRLELGTWQQIVFIDLDNRPRERTLLVQAMGE